LSRREFAATVAAMVWRVQRKHKRVAAALALLGVAFYALLLPGHLASQFNAQLHKADVGMFADAMCLSGDQGTKPMPATSCPICKGLAAFQMAMVPPELAALPVMPHASAAIAALRDDVARASIPPPRSRGPPLHA
jgi:hypothetical protein